MRHDYGRHDLTNQPLSDSQRLLISSRPQLLARLSESFAGRWASIFRTIVCSAQASRI